RRLIIHHLVMVRKLTRQDTRPAWRAKCGCHKRVAQVCAFTRHAIHAWSFKPWHLAHESHKVVAVVIGQNEYYIWTIGLLCGLPLTTGCEQYGTCRKYYLPPGVRCFIHHSVRISLVLMTSRELPPTMTSNSPGSATYSIFML